MTVTVMPITWATGGVETSAADFRRLDVASTMAHDAHGVAARAGVATGLSASMSGMTLTLQPGAAIITPSVSENGSYRAALGSALPIALPARDATYSRRDLVVARVHDADVDSSGLYEATIEVIEGTPAAAPQIPATPSGALPLWVATVPVTGTVALSDQRVWTSALGGVITCTSSTRPSGAGLRAGQLIYEIDTSQVWAWSGASWQMVAEPSRERTVWAGAAIELYTAAGTTPAYTPWAMTLPAGTYRYEAHLVAQVQSGYTSDLLFSWSGVSSHQGGSISARTGDAATENAGARFQSVTSVSPLTVGAGTFGQTSTISGIFVTSGGPVTPCLGRTVAQLVTVQAGSHVTVRRIS